ncbi:hypothetical protein QA612_18710 [Evansella sp. AB-P1]|uniref:hypothetical protein n=1 Tax=Evansella sp. AB-P1 TaxID=3037653 RepID=UPI00241C0243|nr:hypothetical protein [Evansella sp. AB-P1]MDG5789494.1 hypothetical protein [Evansella sp. AB-P1]
MKLQGIYQHLYIFYSIVFILHIGNTFIKSSQIDYFVGLLAIPMLFLSFITATKLFKVIGLVFISIGLFLFISEGHNFLHLPYFMTSTISLLALLAMLPWMNSVVRSGRFDKKLNQLMRANVEDLGKLYPRSAITAYSLGAFLNLTAVPVSQAVLKESLSTVKDKVKNTFIIMTTLRGFSVALLWSPLEVMVALSISTTGVGYASLLPWLLIISIAAFIGDSLWGRFFYRKTPYESPNKNHQLNTKVLMKKIIQLIIALSLFLATVIIIGNVFYLDFILTVTLILFPFAAVWSIIIKRWRTFWTIGWETWKVRTNSMQNFVVLFLALALFSNSLQGTTLLQVIQYPVLSAADYPILILIILQLTFLVMALFGVHPVATIGILSEVITPLLTVMNPLSIAIVLITGSALNCTSGTYGMAVTLTSMNTKQNPYRITALNLPHALYVIVLGTAVAYFLL